MPLALPELMEELVEEVLLHFPSDDPASLVRAAIVCKLWCRLVSSTSFRRMFREFHRRKAPLLSRRFHESPRRALPLLAVICTGNCKLRHDDDTPRNYKPVSVVPSPPAHFLPTTTSSRLMDVPDGKTIDARHGRVLLCRVNVNAWPHRISYSVWDPVTRGQRELPELPWYWHHDYCSIVVCAATADGHNGNCDHLDCYLGHFLVLVMDIRSYVVQLSIYSSEAGAWSHLPGFKLPLPRRVGWLRRPPSVVVGSALYLLIPLYDEIVKYDFATREVSAIPLPSKLRPLKLSILLTDDDGEIGFVVEKNFSSFLLPDPDARRERNTPGKEAVTSTTTEDDAVPASQPKRLRRPSTRVTGPMWLV